VKGKVGEEIQAGTRWKECSWWASPEYGWGGDSPEYGWGGDSPEYGWGGDSREYGCGGDSPEYGWGRDSPEYGWGGDLLRLAPALGVGHSRIGAGEVSK